MRKAKSSSRSMRGLWLRQPGELVADGVQSIAIAFLHSYRNPEHEERAAELVRRGLPNISVSVSSAITREYRESGAYGNRRVGCLHPADF